MNAGTTICPRPRAKALLALAVFGLCLGTAVPGANSAQPPEVDIRRDATVAAIEMVMPSVVNIATETIFESHGLYDVLRRQYYGVPLPQSKSISLGSGVIIDEEGYLLTNFHVINGASRIQVKLWDGREYEAERVEDTPISDVALLRLKGKAGERFKAIKLAADDDLLLGETVLALGNPFGLGGSVTRGILSSKNRRLSAGKEQLDVQDWLETDAAINPGNSGGPLVNLRGELIGLNVAVSHEGEGMGLGFSIPIKQVSVALSRFFRPETRDSLWFGALLKAGPGPLVVGSLSPGSPAVRAGLRENDEIVQVNGKSPRSVISFNESLIKAADRDNRLVIIRAGQRVPLTVRLLALDEMFRQRLGMTFRPVDNQAAARSGLRPGTALLVDEVERDGAAARAGLERGHVVARLEGATSMTIKGAADAVLDKKRGETIRLIVAAHRQVAPGLVESREAPVDLKVR